MDSYSLDYDLCLFLSFTEDNCCSFILMEMKTKNVLIIGDKAGDKTPFEVTSEDILSINDEDFFNKKVEDNMEQHFKRYEYSE